MLKKIALSTICILLIFGFMVTPVMAKEGVKVFMKTGSNADSKINTLIAEWLDDNPYVRIVSADTEILIKSSGGALVIVVTVQYRTPPHLENSKEKN